MISDSTRKYLKFIDSLSEPEDPAEASKIHVDYVASKIATLYEKLRQVIDYQEEHLLRKNTIQRILKRRLLLSSTPEEIAKPLVFELIRGGYFPNDKIPETRVKKIENILSKYVFLMENSPAGSEKSGLVEWLKSLAATEIEEKMLPARNDDALLEYMVDELLRRLQFIDVSLEEDRKKELIFIACQKALLKADQALLSWRLLKFKLPEFANSPNLDLLVKFSESLPAIKKGVEESIGDPLIRRIQLVAYRFVPGFLIIRDIVAEDSGEAKKIFDNSETLEARLKFVYEKRYKRTKIQNRTWGLRWVISILLSKMFLAFLIEIPYDRIADKFSYVSLGVNLFVPPLLMFLIIASIRVPKEKNKKLVCDQTMNVVYPKKELEIIVIKKPPEKKGFKNLFLRTIFLASSALVFGGVIYLLLKINFSWVSITIFLAFFSLIAFSGMKIESSSKQLKAADREKEEGILSFIADVFFLPFRNAGKWLSGQLQKYNLIILILNLFFEAPLQIFFEFIESWRNFIKAKKEE
ncbi:hypothetical protein KKH63_00485, partial [Patescibacteria group bacterium]|nr:hypothetical protein [Patescibacteria group bacterium]